MSCTARRLPGPRRVRVDVYPYLYSVEESTGAVRNFCYDCGRRLTVAPEFHSRWCKARRREARKL